MYKSHRILFKEGPEPIGLRVHETKDQLIARRHLHDLQMRTMDIDRIIMQPVKTAMFYPYLSLTTGKMHAIRETGDPPPTPLPGFHIDTVHSYILRILA